MPRIHLPDGTVLDAPYDLDRNQLRAWVKEQVSQRSKPAPGFHPGIGSLPFPRDIAEAESAADVNRGQSAALGTAMATGPGGVLQGAGAVGRVLTNPFTVGAVTAGSRMAGGTSPARAVSEGVLASLFAGPRIARAGRKFQELMRRSAERFGSRAGKVAEEAIDIPGRTLTRPSAPPFVPKGKMRLDLGPREQTTMTGTVETARPALPKPQFSSTGSVPRGKVTQPNVRVRAEGSMDPAKQGPATASSPVTPRSTPAGKGGQESAGGFGEYEERVVRIVRDTNRSKQSIIDMFRKETGATPEQARTVIDAIFGKRGLTRQ